MDAPVPNLPAPLDAWYSKAGQFAKDHPVQSVLLVVAAVFVLKKL